MTIGGWILWLLTGLKIRESEELIFNLIFLAGDFKAVDLGFIILHVTLCLTILFMRT